MTDFSRKFHFIYCLTFLVLFVGCSSDDVGSIDQDDFYSNALSNVDEGLLKQYWSITSVVFEGETFPVPIDFLDCGRDFFIFNDEGKYIEYLFTSSDCSFSSQQLNWSISNGVITLRNNIGQTDEMVVTSLNSSRLTFKVRLDVDEDGIPDVVTINANAYQPRDFDRYSSTFFNVYDNPLVEIKFEWLAYDGFEGFDRYEIYRSESDCTKDNAQLIETITQVGTNTFTDLAPPPKEELCYFLRIYNQNGLLGESELVGFSTSQLEVPGINQKQPTINGNTILLSWDSFSGNYFDRYEITVSNQDPGITGYGDQEYVVASIEDITVTNFTVDEIPYIENPTYTVYAYTIFGQRSYAEMGTTTSAWTVPIKRDEIIDLEAIESFAISNTEPIIYFYGHTNNTYAIHRYNYETNITEAISDRDLNTLTSAPVKIITSTSGTEVTIEQGSELLFFTEDLNYKYGITHGTLPSFDDYEYLGNNIWVFIANNRIYSFSRNVSTLTEIALTELYDNAPTYTGYRMVRVDGGVLVGHHQETTSIFVNLDENGALIATSELTIPFTSDFLDPAIFNEGEQILVNPTSNAIYDVQNAVLVGQFQFPQFPTGVSTDATKVWGTNNDPNWSIETASAHEKEVIDYNRSSENFSAYTTLGYSHAVFENYLGKTYSISSGFKRERLRSSLKDRNDIFIELISN